MKILLQQIDILRYLLGFLSDTSSDIVNLKLTCKHWRYLVEMLVPSHNFFRNVLDLSNRNTPTGLEIPSNYQIQNSLVEKLQNISWFRAEQHKLIAKFLVYFSSSKFCIQVIQNFYFSIEQVMLNAPFHSVVRKQVEPMHRMYQFLLEHSLYASCIVTSKWTKLPWDCTVLGTKLLPMFSHFSRMPYLHYSIDILFENRNMLLFFILNRYLLREACVTIITHPLWNNLYEKDLDMIVALISNYPLRDYFDLLLCDEFKTNKAAALRLLDANFGVYLLLPEVVRSLDTDIAVKVIMRNPRFFVTNGEVIDRGIAFTAIKRDGTMLQYLSDELLQDKQLVIEAVRNDGTALQYARQWQNDREIVSFAIMKNSEALQFASKELQNDKEIVLMSVRCNGRNLQYASNERKDDREVVWEAICNSAEAILFASDRWKTDVQMIARASLINPYITKCLTQNNKVNVYAALLSNMLPPMHRKITLWSQ